MLIAILELLQAATLLLPTLALVQPLVDKAMAGGTLTDEDIAALQAATAALSAQAEALETAAIGDAPVAAPGSVAV